MTATISAASTPIASERANAAEDPTQRMLLLETLEAHGEEEPILLDQTTTHVCVSRSTDLPAGQIAIHRSALGWKFQAHGADCRLNGIAVEDGWLCAGDRISVASTEFRVRHATTDELLGHLPQTDPAARDEEENRLVEQQISIAARARDLAEWEICLSECEADLRISPRTTGELESYPGDVELAVAADRAELHELRTNPATLEADRQRLEGWLAMLRDERSVLQQERERLAVDQASLADQQPPATNAKGEPAVPATPATTVSTKSVLQPAAIRQGGPSSVVETHKSRPVGMEWHQPRRNLDASRLCLNNLRDVANQSARSALARHFWKQHRAAVVLKVVLAGFSLALACKLYWQHGGGEATASGVIWGAAAIGLITLSGLVHTWTEVNRLNTRFRPAETNEPHECAEAKASKLLPGT